MNNKDCLQFIHGPTPCFQLDVKNKVCSLNFCPVAEILTRNPDANAFDLLHSHCVMSDTYGLQDDFEEGKGEYIAAIASLKT